MRMAGAVTPGTVSASVLLGGTDACSLPVDTKEGEDIYPSDRTADGAVAANTLSSVSNKVNKEKSVKIGRGKGGEDLEGLLAEVGLTDIRDESDDSYDEYAVAASSKSKKKVRTKIVNSFL